jgi:hypothetical protein
MSAHEEIARLLKDAAASMKRDAKSAVASLEQAYALANGAGVADDTAVVAEELARGWARRGSHAKSLYYAVKATELSGEHRSTWSTLAKTCELVASRTKSDGKRRRTAALYRAAARSFKKAAALTKDREDAQWLKELAGEAQKQADARAPK